MKFLAARKRAAMRGFSWDRSQSLEQMTRLAFWLHHFGRDEDALEVATFLAQYEFSGNHNLWSWIELALALRCRLLRQIGRQDKAGESVQRIRDAGFVASRLKGVLLKDREIDRAVARSDRRAERDWRENQALELCWLIEMGGSRSLPVESLESRYLENQQRLQELQD